MKKRTLAAAVALLTVATGVTAGSVNATPTPGPERAVGYSALTTDTQAIVTTDSGTVVIEDETLKLKAVDGTVVAGLPLKFRIDEFEFPIAAEIAGNTATLTPQLAIDKAVYEPVALPYEDQAPWKTEYEREQAAWSRMTSTISMGATIGTLVGGLTGAGIGCVLGGITGAAGGTLGTLFGGLPAGLIGCLIGAAGIGALGTIVGQIFITAPVAIAAGIQYFTTINQPSPKPAPTK
ncbi:hypothetical protein [Nocardia noduli]|uniref:hypothetical protein n=1 Tax=Nocardia noduli TaxID=2815722 RepID=UPI001C225288|nr:hypothetical protein [Nocardia noduli]